MRTNLILVPALFLALCGCAGGRTQTATDLNIALDVAAAAEGAYAARPTADPKTVAQLSRLLAAAQSAVTAWQVSTQPNDQAVASAAIAALVEYEAAAGVRP